MKLDSCRNKVSAFISQVTGEHDSCLSLRKTEIWQVSQNSVGKVALQADDRRHFCIVFFKEDFAQFGHYMKISVGPAEPLLAQP